MKEQKMSNIEAFVLILIIIISHLVLNLPQTIINTSGSGSLLNIIYISLIVILLCLLINKLFKPFPNADLLDVSEFLGGKILKNIFGIVLISYLIFTASVLLRNVTENLKIVYYFKNSSAFVIIFLVVTPIIANFFGQRSIVKLNLIITPLVIIIFIVAFLGVSPLFVWQRIFPILGYGINNTFGALGISNVFALNGILIIMLIPSMLAKPDSFKKISLYSMFASATLLLLFVGTLLLAFPFILSSEFLTPIYLLVSNSQLGTFFQRPEALSIFVLIMFFICYLNVIVMFCTKIFAKVTNIKNSKLMSYSFSALLFIGSFIPRSVTTVRFLENTVYKYITLAITFIISILILIFANIKYKFRKKEVDKNE